MAAEAAPRRSERVRGASDFYNPSDYATGQANAAFDGGQTDLCDSHDWVGHAYAVGADAVPKNYNDIANFEDLQSERYESYQRELENMYGMKVLTAIIAADVPAGETILSLIHISEPTRPY